MLGHGQLVDDPYDILYDFSMIKNQNMDTDNKIKDDLISIFSEDDLMDRGLITD